MDPIKAMFLKSGIFLAILFLSVSAASQNINADGRMIYPGMKGFTADIKGGSGGRIIRVTNLSRDGAGSLGEAVRAKGPRIIVFEVAGTIDLAWRSIGIVEPFVTIAGQTAPYPGITLIRGGINIGTHDVIITHLKVRPGEAGREKNSGWDVDGISTVDGAWNVIIDHCSITWATDENISASGPQFEGSTPEEWRKNTSHRIIISNCIIAEGLSNSTHSKGEHSKGSLVHDNVTEIIIMNNLYASNVERNPLFKGGTSGIVLNNLIYNPGGAAIHYSLSPQEWQGRQWITGELSIIGNYIEFGPDTRKNLPAASFRGPVSVYWNDNAISGSPEAREFSGEFKRLKNAPLWPEGLVAIPSAAVKDFVLENAGAFPYQRDHIDRRIVNEVFRRTARIINSEKEVGGYPDYRPVFRNLRQDLLDSLSRL